MVVDNLKKQKHKKPTQTKPLVTNVMMEYHSKNTDVTIVEGNMPNDSVQRMAKNVINVVSLITLQNIAEANAQYSLWLAMTMMTLAICLLELYQE